MVLCMRAGKKLPVILAIPPACAVLAAGAWVTDKLLSRPDRIRHAACTADLQSARDAVLRYEYRTGALPPSLDALVPRYLRRQQLFEGERPLYRYDREDRTLATADEFRIRGLFVRYRPVVALHLPPPQPAPLETVPMKAAIGSGTALVTPVGPDLPPPPEGAFVFEAEHWSEMNYGWEIHPDAAAAGGAHIRCKEDTTTGTSQCFQNTFNFYDIEEKREQTVLKYHFRLPNAGRYLLYGRMWATCSHCSNSINVGIDRGGLVPGSRHKDYYGDFMGSRVPFRWRWARTRRSYTLNAGDHYLHVFPHEDGMWIDQFMLVPVTRHRSARIVDTAYRENLPPNRNTAFADRADRPLHLSFDPASRVFTAEMPCDCRLVVRRLRVVSGTSELRVFLHAADPGGADVQIGRFALDLDGLPELGFIPLDFSKVDCAALPRREYLLTARITRGDRELGSCRVVLMHPFVWEVSHTLPYIANPADGPLDGDRESGASDSPQWQRFADTNWNPMGILDFGMHTVGNTLHAPEWRTIYARTRIHVPEAGVYLLKAQSDDQMRLWIDGKDVARINSAHSAIRNTRRFKVRLEKGRHRVRMRINQGPQVRKLQGGYWQASLRFRTEGDRLSNVTGIE